MRRHSAAEDFPWRTEKAKPDSLGIFRLYEEEPEFFDIPEINERRTCTDIAGLIVLAVLVVIWGAIFIVIILNSDVRRYFHGYDLCGNVCGVKNKFIEEVPCSGEDYTGKNYLLHGENDERRRRKTWGTRKFTYPTITTPKNITSYSTDSTTTQYPDTNDDDSSDDDDYNLYHDGSSGSKYWGFNIQSGSSRSKRWLWMKSEHQTCVEKCPENSIIVGLTCYREERMIPFEVSLGKDIISCLWVYAVSWVLCIVIVLVCIFCLKKWTYFVVWTSIFSSMVAILVYDIFLWCVSLIERNEKSDIQTNPNFYHAISASSGLLIQLLVVFCLRKRINMVIQLYKMSLEIVGHMKTILLQTLLTLLSMCAVVCLTTFSFLIILYGGKLEPIKGSVRYGVQYDYGVGILQIFALFLTVFMGIWMLMFAIHCQIFIVAYPTICYYFSRDPSNVKCRICLGYVTLTRFHLGTVASGSLIMAIMATLRAMTENATKNRRHETSNVDASGANVVHDICGSLERLLSMFTENAYIECAMHGRPLCKSGLRAVRLFWANFLDVVAFETLTRIVSFMLTLFPIVIASAVAYILLDYVVGELTKPPIGFIVCFFVIFGIIIFTAGVTIGILQLVIDTVLVCYCEDQEINDGIVRPYYMSRELMLYMEAKYEEAKTRPRGCMSCF